LTAVCRGHAAHSAAPARGVNAIYMASELIDRIRARQATIEASGPRDPGYEVPYTTLHVGVIHGGTVLNIVPSRCDLEFEIRNLPADDATRIVEGMRADALAIARGASREDTGIDVEVTNEYPPLDTPADSAVVALAAALTGQQECIKVGFGSEGGLFSERLGIATVVCGPGSIDQAHKPDEFIERDQMERCDAMMAALLNRLV
jgi:acetylornithine deacetylase